MAQHPHVAVYPTAISTVRSLVQFLIAKPGTIEQIKMYTDIGPTVTGFQIEYVLNGAVIHTQNLGTVAADTPMTDNDTALAYPVDEGDILLIRSSAIGSFASMGPRTHFQVTVEDGLPSYLYGTTADSLVMGLGIQTFDTNLGMAWEEVGGRVRISRISNPNTHFMEGVVYAYSGGPEMQVDVDFMVGSGTHSNWRINVAGELGRGLGYGGESTTSLALGTGSKSFTVTSGDNQYLAYVPGTRVRAASAANPTTKYMDGIVTSYDSGTGVLVVTMDSGVGTGTYADWGFSIVGDPGATGATGATGAAGTNGTNGTNGTSGAVYDDTIAHTTASMADGATVDETLTGIGKSYIISRVTADVDCRVRVYRNAAYRTADAARAIGTLPDGDHGVILDIVLETAGLGLDLWTSRAPIGVNAESTRVADAAIAVTNMSGSTDTVTLNFEALILES